MRTAPQPRVTRFPVAAVESLATTSVGSLGSALSKFAGENGASSLGERAGAAEAPGLHVNPA
jgi:hypothetical protein